MNCDRCDAKWDDDNMLQCPVCGFPEVVEAELASNPYQAPAEVTRPTTVGSQRGVVAVAVTVVVGIVISFALFPGAAVPLIVAVCIAAVRTNSAVNVAIGFGELSSIKLWAVAFAKSLAVTILVALATFITFFLVCTGTVMVSQASETAAMVGMLLCGVVPLGIFFELMRRTWPGR